MKMTYVGYHLCHDHVPNRKFARLILIVKVGAMNLRDNLVGKLFWVNSHGYQSPPESTALWARGLCAKTTGCCPMLSNSGHIGHYVLVTLVLQDPLEE